MGLKQIFEDFAYGFTVGKKKAEKEEQALQTIVPKNLDDGSVEVAAGGAFGAYIDLEEKARNEAQLVTKYRQMAGTSETDNAIQDICNEAIIVDENKKAVSLSLDKVKKLSPDIKSKIIDEFNYIYDLLDFSNNGYEIFRRWYVDGRLYYHLLINNEKPREGIKDLRQIDPRRIRKIRIDKKEVDPKTGADIFVGYDEYYLYYQKVSSMGEPTPGTKAVKIAADAIVYNHSGVIDDRNNLIYSHLHKAIKPLNQLNMLEDAAVIYRLARAPERRIFYIDVGNLPKMKAEQYVRDMMVKHKNKLVYNVSTGEIKDDRRHMTMLEDFWLPRREGGKSTEITTLPGGQNLGEMTEVDYFLKKLYKALNVPVSRLESENNFNLGRASEITRDELKFSKFVGRLRNRFAMLFDDVLEIQLALKGIVSRKEWNKIKQNAYYDFVEDNHFTELKQSEMFREKLSLLGEAENFREMGEYFSKEWIYKNVLRFEDYEIEEIQKQLKKEKGEDEPEPSDDGGGEEGEAEPVEPPKNVANPPDFTPPTERPPETNSVLTNNEKTLIEKYNQIITNLNNL